MLTAGADNLNGRETDGGMETGGFARRMPTRASLHHSCFPHRPPQRAPSGTDDGNQLKTPTLQTAQQHRRQRYPQAKCIIIASPGQRVTYQSAGPVQAVQELRSGPFDVRTSNCNRRIDQHRTVDHP